jgi:beta-glucosidase
MSKGVHFFLQKGDVMIFLPLVILSFVTAVAIAEESQDSPLVAFAKRPTWEEPVDRAPVEIGFATADFQDNGPAVHPNTNWGALYLSKLRPVTFVPDIWNHPERVIDRLMDLGVKKFRFSVSRDKIEEGQLQHYINFCRQLRRRGIEVMVTLHHFTDPLHFSWERPEDVKGFVDYAVTVARALYNVGVRKIVTINEPTVVAFQGWVMGEFPPNKTWNFEGAAKVLENMMQAHVQVYEALKSRYPDLEIGISHDPIRFRHYHKHNPLFSPAERAICYYLTELNHSALMRFFQTGKFSLDTPFCTKYQFEHPKPPPLDFIGLQYYTDPLLRLPYGSVSRIEGEKIASYQFRPYPQGLASALDEMRTLNVPIDLTEIGIDIGINQDETDRERLRYFDRIFQVVRRAKEEGVNVRSLYFWTLIDNLEWHKQFDVCLGFYRFDPTTGEITPRPVALWLKRMIANQRMSQQ